MQPNHSLLIFTLWILASVHIARASVFDLDPDETRSFHELIASRGYVLQEYHVMTSDGYILTVHRVVTRDYNPADYNVFRKPLIAMHGIFNDATFWYFNSPHMYSNTSYCGDNFGFCMMRTGRYDLWVPNARGNGRSNLHIKYSDKDKRFWAFSWDHIATYDLPAVIDLVRTQTGHKTVGYVGFSQGCAAMFGLLSLQPQYAQIIKPFVAWAPAVFIGRATSVIGPALRQLWPIVMKPGMFPIGNPTVNGFSQWYGCRPSAGRATCNLLLNAFFGQSNINVTRIPTYASFGPNPSSNWQVAHFGQNGQSNRFARFNYGSEEANMRAYGRPSPPDYPLHNIPPGFKVLIMHGATDGMVHPLDARKLISILRTNGVHVTGHFVNNPTWSHADFVIGQNSGYYVYDHTLRYLDLHAWD